MSESDWEFEGQNPFTGKKYWKKKEKKGGKEEKVTKEKETDLTNVPYDRGNYNADIVAEEMEKREEEKERAIRQAKGLPPEDEF